MMMWLKLDDLVPYASCYLSVTLMGGMKMIIEGANTNYFKKKDNKKGHTNSFCAIEFFA